MVQTCNKDQAETMRANLSKEEMFQAFGQPIENLRTGNNTSDPNLDKLHMALYDNVMILDPSPTVQRCMSPIQPQIPSLANLRWSLRDAAGYLTVAARISNQAIHSLSIGDVASFISCKMAKRLGIKVQGLQMVKSSELTKHECIHLIKDYP